ncbi:hypothetical protein [Aeromonas veronii]|uniref:hypothetical protein n=1 Tax=Aeromonas veronii TaxID=654 RepID=UPI00226D33CF|nr:hypothetical protein [Aeromonas veronii]MCX9103488.1 hypothetical protein [Aeromonas veronii]MCX9119139.1 hypothetical protein [Aeromonas veronii]
MDIDLPLGKEIRIISVDIFDTLLLRNGYSEERRFMLAAKKTKELCPAAKSTVRDIFVSRYMSHHWLYRLYQQKQLNKEPTIQEILGIQLSMLADNFISLQMLLDAELAVESEVLVLNEDLYSWLKAQVQCGIKVVFFSDMYLSSEIINALLLNNGVGLPFDLFVSCESGVSKHQGTAFPWLSNKYNVSTEEMLHLGDNYLADYCNAISAGVNALHTPRSAKFYLLEDAFKWFDKLWLRSGEYA